MFPPSGSGRSKLGFRKPEDPTRLPQPVCLKLTLHPASAALLSNQLKGVRKSILPSLVISASSIRKTYIYPSLVRLRVTYDETS